MITDGRQELSGYNSISLPSGGGPQYQWWLRSHTAVAYLIETAVGVSVFAETDCTSVGLNFYPSSLPVSGCLNLTPQVRFSFMSGEVWEWIKALQSFQVKGQRVNILGLSGEKLCKNNSHLLFYLEGSHKQSINTRAQQYSSEI